MKKIALFLIFICLILNIGHATQFRVEFHDYGKLQWTGIADTKTDNLTIQSWQGDQCWNPQIPMVWSATDNNLQPYDVPDTWDGTIGNWGFISQVSNADTIWEEGPVDVGSYQHRFYMGWGAGNLYYFNVGFHRADEDLNHNWTYLVLENGHYGGQIAPDEISVTGVPEPTTLSLLTLGAFLAGRRRRS